MKEHEATHDTNRPQYECGRCGKLTLFLISVHLRSHTSQRPFRYSKCPKTFTTKGNMKEYEATHNTNRPQYECARCVCSCVLFPISVHLRSHTGQRPFRCSKCPKTFTTKGNMKEHEATHDTNRPQYECERCGKLFKQLKCLKIHARIHTGERPYK